MKVSIKVLSKNIRQFLVIGAKIEEDNRKVDDTITMMIDQEKLPEDQSTYEIIVSQDFKDVQPPKPVAANFDERPVQEEPHPIAANLQQIFNNYVFDVTYQVNHQQVNPNIGLAYNQALPIVVISSHQDQNVDEIFSAEEKYRKEVGFAATEVFVVKNHRNEHWDSSRKNEEGRTDFPSSGRGNACGAYTLLNIIKNSPTMQTFLEIHNSLTNVEIDIARDVNSLSEKQVRRFVFDLISTNQKTLIETGVSAETISGLLQRVISDDTRLISDDIRFAFLAAGIVVLEANELVFAKHNVAEVARNICANISKRSVNAEANYSNEMARLEAFLRQNHPDNWQNLLVDIAVQVSAQKISQNQEEPINENHESAIKTYEEIHKILHELIDKQALNKLGLDLGEFFVLDTTLNPQKSLLSEAVFLYGIPLFLSILSDIPHNPQLTKEEISNLIANAKSFYSGMVDAQNAGSHTELLHGIFVEKNIDAAVDLFFKNLFEDFLRNDELENEGLFRATYGYYADKAKRVYKEYFKTHSVFAVFKDNFEVKDEKARKELLEKDIEHAGFLESASLVTKFVNIETYKNLRQLCLKMVFLYKINDAITPDYRFGSNSMLQQFVLNLFEQQYGLGNSLVFNPSSIADDNLKKVLSYLSSIFMLTSAKGWAVVDRNLEDLQRKIRHLKSKGELDEEIQKLYSDKIPEKLLKAIKAFELFQKEIDEIAPNAELVYEEVIFSFSKGIHQMIARVNNIATSFQKKYKEISEYEEKRKLEVVAAMQDMHEERRSGLEDDEKKLEDLESKIAAIDQLGEELEEEYKKLEIDSYKKYAKTKRIQKQKDDSKKQDVIKFNAHEFVEMDSINVAKMGDPAFNKERYRLLFTKGLYEFLEGSGCALQNAVKSSLQNGFIPPNIVSGSKSHGIKMLNNGEKVSFEKEKELKGKKTIEKEEYILVEIKIAGNLAVKTSDGDESNVGDVRFCGVYRDGVIMIVAVDTHKTLSKTVQAIKDSVQKGDIRISIESERDTANVPSNSPSMPEAKVKEANIQRSGK